MTPGLVARTLRPVMRIVIGDLGDKLLAKRRSRSRVLPLDRRVEISEYRPG